MPSGLLTRIGPRQVRVTQVLESWRARCSQNTRYALFCQRIGLAYFRFEHIHLELEFFDLGLVFVRRSHPVWFALDAEMLRDGGLQVRVGAGRRNDAVGSTTMNERNGSISGIRDPMAP